MKGSIKKRGKTYSVRYDAGINPETGKRIQKFKGGFQNRKDAERFLTEKLFELNRDNFSLPKKEFFKPFLLDWFETKYKKNVSIRTWEGREYMLHKHLIPKFAHYKLQEITTYELDAFYAYKVESGLSPKTVKDLHNLMNLCLSQAVKWGYLKYNPARDSSPPRLVEKEIQTWDYDTTKLFLQVARKEGKDAFYTVAVFTGMRRGELLGLKWADVNFKQKKLYIQRSLSYTKSEGYLLKNTKTSKSKRQISISTQIVDSLMEHRQKQDELKEILREGYEDHDLVFPNQFGGFKNPDNLRREFNCLVQKVKVHRITIHGLRHTHATWLLKNGINPKVVSERLGHNDVSITLKTYSHVSSDLQEEAADKLEEAYNEWTSK